MYCFDVMTIRCDWIKNPDYEQNGFASLLELVLCDRTLTESVSQHYESINNYIEQILVIPVRPCHVDYNNNLTCHLQDILNNEWRYSETPVKQLGYG
ncbi:uncharacterized protein LOC121996772 isoform X11 [Zingiber officinale]|uniref:uncharacterized protein LOC121996772 isoform X11 n=1 Tax=Zingiber officinale TaxID=94328 RepID=UPI001C4B805C|nr:uncharacterized protein LOC121996772 isoform X11 [Zingiber officinale]XP_042406810.1 uncharacterized protein LOC121996772 isoform X11 [Zingiber officinale]